MTSGTNRSDAAERDNGIHYGHDEHDGHDVISFVVVLVVSSCSYAKAVFPFSK